ncbi:MAG: GNAT family N-acetyltransferase [Vibrionaceae bacterium]
MTLQNNGVNLRPARRDEKNQLWHDIYVNQEWKKFDAPYLPLAAPSPFQFGRHLFQRLQEGKTAQIIEHNGKAVGYISYYCEEESSHWLEIGITLFYQEHWGLQIGRKALNLWISHIFNTLQVARVGLTTWSGNPRMMRCAQSLGMRQEARIRKVLFYQGQYYDSVRYGLLKEEWREQNFLALLG